MTKEEKEEKDIYEYNGLDLYIRQSFIKRIEDEYSPLTRTKFKGISKVDNKDGKYLGFIEIEYYLEGLSDYYNIYWFEKGDLEPVYNYIYEDGKVVEFYELT